MADLGYVRLYGCKPESTTVGLSCGLHVQLYADPVCDDSAAEASYAAIAALYK